MNLKETKQALENGVKDALQKALTESIKVNAIYNADQGAMNVTIIENEEAKEGKNAHILYYGITYKEEEESLAVVAFNRVFVTDELSVVNVVVEPVVVNDKFISSLKNIIMFGMDKVYHPENYPSEEPKPADEGANEADAPAAEELNIEK